MLPHMWCAVDANTIGASQVKNDELPIWMVLDLSMIARDALVLNNDIIAELTTNIDDRFFDAIDLLASLWKPDRQPGRGQSKRWG